jgi:hypothetical protein
MSLDPYGDAAPTPTTFWRPRESERGIYTEKKMGDEMLALWETSDLPADAFVTHVTLIPYRGEKAVVAWKDGRYWLPEGDVHAGEDVDAAVKRIALEQAGIMNPTIVHLGHFRSKATTASRTQAPGAVTFQALFGLESGGFADFPADPAYERRVILQRDLNTLIRSSYVERRREFVDSLDPWLLSRLKAGLR